MLKITRKGHCFAGMNTCSGISFFLNSCEAHRMCKLLFYGCLLPSGKFPRHYKLNVWSIQVASLLLCVKYRQMAVDHMPRHAHSLYFNWGPHLLATLHIYLSRFTFGWQLCVTGFLYVLSPLGRNVQMLRFCGGCSKIPN